MTPEQLVLLAVVVPFLGVAPILLAHRYPNLREALSLATSAILIVAVALLWRHVDAGGRPEVILGEMLPGLPIVFRLEPLGMLFAIVAAGLWPVTTIYSIGYMRGHHEKNQTRFYAYFAVAIGSAIGIAFSGNMLTLFIFYEILTIGTFPLVTHAGSEEAKRAGRVYLGVLLGTSVVFQLLAIIWTWTVAGTLDFQPGGILSGKIAEASVAPLFALYIFGIGKAAVMPFHRWLPAAMVAPTPVSALLHAVAVVKAGVFTVLKVTVYVFGIDLLSGTGAGFWLQWIAAFTIIAASIVAMTKDNLKARLAYSTISQLSYVVLGATLATPLGIVGGAMQIAMHAAGKITLFFCAGAVLVACHRTEISTMRGIGRAMPLTMGAFLVAALSIVGLPPLGGAWSKWYLALGALDAGQAALVAVLMASSLLSLSYLLPIPLRAFFSAPTGGGHGAGDGTHEQVHGEAPWPCLVAIGITVTLCVAMFLFPEPLYRLSASVVGL